MRLGDSQVGEEERQRSEAQGTSEQTEARNLSLPYLTLAVVRLKCPMFSWEVLPCESSYDIRLVCL